MTPQQVQRTVFEEFRKTRSRAGHILYMRTFRFGVMRFMNPDEQREFLDGLNEMISRGLITYEGGRTGMDLIRLSELGYQQLYTPRADYLIAEALLNEFRRTNVQINDFLPMRNINFNFIPTLNPMEQDRFEYVANRLIDERYIDYHDHQHYQLEGLVLLQNGYNFIVQHNIEQLREIFERH